ncbi:MAG: YeeE/YedE family protein [Cyclobacteriaceae bacterium]|nr:YeeE/YedE family protein [Cyclobacteriaceae bacterium]
MGPLVPSIISDEFDLIIAIILGFGFGFILEQAGFSSSKKLVGLFYGYNFVVLKVFFTAGITAMIGVLAFSHFGLLDISLIYVNPTFLKSAIVGGLVMGVGFIVGGFCPGTSVCASAIGKLDGITFVLGSFLGIYFFMEIYPFISDMYFEGGIGAVTMPEMLGISQISFALILSISAIGIFVLVTYIESRVNKTSFELPKKKVVRMSILALVPILIIAVTGFMPNRLERIEAQINDPVNLKAAEAKSLDPDKLAFEIVHNYYKWNVIDVRSPEAYKAWHLPLSINIPLDSMLNREWETYFKQTHKKNIFYSDDMGQTKKAFVLSQVIGKADDHILNGTSGEFRTMFFEPQRPQADASKDMVDLYNFRKKSGIQMNDLSKSLERFHSKPKVRKPRKVQGGCA